MDEQYTHIEREYINKWETLDHKGNTLHGSGDCLRYSAEWIMLYGENYDNSFAIQVRDFINACEELDEFGFGGKFYRNPDKTYGKTSKDPLIALAATYPHLAFDIYEYTKRNWGFYPTIDDRAPGIKGWFRYCFSIFHFRNPVYIATLKVCQADRHKFWEYIFGIGILFDLFDMSQDVTAQKCHVITSWENKDVSNPFVEFCIALFDRKMKKKYPLQRDGRIRGGLGLLYEEYFQDSEHPLAVALDGKYRFEVLI